MVSTRCTIGEFAAFWHVSARMLLHYDAIGLLRPSEVDERSGYRRYAPDQLVHLLRIVELRDYGCSLDDIAAVVVAPVGDRGHPGEDALGDLLERRRAESTESLAVDASRLRTAGPPSSVPPRTPTTATWPGSAPPGTT